MTKKKSFRTRKIYWECDKEGCKETNFREIPYKHVVNDDVCDYCGRNIHEPRIEDHKKKGK